MVTFHLGVQGSGRCRLTIVLRRRVVCFLFWLRLSHGGFESQNTLRRQGLTPPQKCLRRRGRHREPGLVNGLRCHIRHLTQNLGAGRHHRYGVNLLRTSHQFRWGCGPMPRIWRLSGFRRHSNKANRDAMGWLWLCLVLSRMRGREIAAPLCSS